MRLFLLPLLFLAVVPATAHAGGVAITEIAANPALPEPGGEFVVLTNTSLGPVVLDGMRLTDSGRSTRGVVPPNTSLDPGQRIALQPGSGAEAYSCEPKPHRALLTAWAQLNNTGDTVILEAADGRELDRVTYDADAFAVEGPSRVWDAPRERWTTSAGNASPCSVPPPRPGRFRFARAETTVAESAPAATFEVLRSGGTNGRISVPWRALDASATRGSDYSAQSGTVTFAAGAERASFTVPLLDDVRDEPDETFTVVLGGEGVDVTEPPRAVVRILDDDPPAPPILIEPAPVMPMPPTPRAPTQPTTPAAPPAPTQTPPSPAQPTPQPPRASLQVAAWQRVVQQRGITAVASCTCDLTLTGRITSGARLATTTRHLTGPTLITLRLPARYVRPLRRALQRRGSLKATITATPNGGAPIKRTVRVR